MSYRQPAFMVRNYMAELLTDPTTQIISRAHTVALNNDGKRSIIDYRVGASGQWTVSAAFSGIEWDFPGVLPVNMNRAVLAPGHTLSGKDWYLVSSNPSALTQRFNPALVSDSGVFDMEFVSTTSDQDWIFLSADTSASEVLSITEFTLGVYYQLSADAYVQPSFQNAWESQIIETEYPGGIASTELAPPRRKFSLTVRNVAPGSSDDTQLNEVLEKGRARPFWYWPPDTNDAGPYLVQLDSDGERAQESSAPSVALKYKYTFRMVEQSL